MLMLFVVLVMRCLVFGCVGLGERVLVIYCIDVLLVCMVVVGMNEVGMMLLNVKVCIVGLCSGVFVVKEIYEEVLRYM